MSSVLNKFQHVLVVLLAAAILLAVVGQFGNDYYLRIAFTMCTYYLCAAGMPFDVTRAYDEATQYADPRIWTAERDQQMWQTLED